ncbi:multiple sugar transport system permease protein [Streptomyces sp. Amel2xB2]|uniref:carbohydrate ABC transporter permease n=1 Tax=Streptomyces sp. Amel2xB2 TaxID=1305829 RepID=UPI000DB9C423|nr:sugar ABC transporter permease [Streptomyces sp. Amel2xB2]RAJ70096.1 multiple sugar transport system permease protein [Streptomyces sp. Amel2xB2]
MTHPTTAAPDGSPPPGAASGTDAGTGTGNASGTADARRPRPRPRTGPRRPRTASSRENRAGLAFVTPTLVVVTVVVVLPILWTVLLAFQDARLVDIQGMGLLGDWSLRNFASVFASPGFWTSLWTTLLYTAGSTAGSILLGLVAALALRRPFRGRGLVRGSMLLPYVAPVVAVAFVWEIALSPQFGVVNEWGAKLLGWDDPVAFLSTRSYEVSLFGLDFELPLALLTVIAFETWRYFPFAFLFLLARLQAVPGSLEEAAKVDGAAPTQRFRHVLLPQLMPVVALLCVLRFIMEFNKFDDVYLLTGGGSGTDVVAVRVYDFLTARFDVGAAAAQALVLAVILMALLGLYFTFFGRKVQEERS